MCRWFSDGGCDAAHTLDLPGRNLTSDDDVISTADRDARIVVTKDADFVDSHLLLGKPEKLLLISIGNISNDELEPLITAMLTDLIREFESARFIEIHRTGLIVRG
jgi:predicted nuclease of predicted toxin-antitoxin system